MLRVDVNQNNLLMLLNAKATARNETLNHY